VGGATETVNDDFISSPEKETSEMWTGTTTFMTSTSSGSSSDVPLPETTIVDRDDFVSSKPYDGDKPLMAFGAVATPRGVCIPSMLMVNAVRSRRFLAKPLGLMTISEDLLKLARMYGGK